MARGWAIRSTQLRRAHARRLTGRRTLVLVISDGLDTGEPPLLDQELQWLKRHSRRLLWLNPLLRFEGYAPLRAVGPVFCTAMRTRCWRSTISAHSNSSRRAWRP